MENIIQLFSAIDLKNNRGLLIGLVIVAVIIAIALIVFFVMLPKIKARAKTKAQAKAERKQDEAEKFAKNVAYDDEAFSDRTNHNRKISVGNYDDNQKVLSTMKHEHKITKVERQEQIVDEQQKARSEDVVSILQGGVATSKANKTYDFLGDKKLKDDRKKSEELSKAQSEDVISILQGGVATSKANKTYDFLGDKKIDNNFTGNEKEASDILDMMGTNAKKLRDEDGNK